MENKQRCAKCAEENPTEAVLCWACFTPLSSGGASKSTRQPTKSSVQTFSDDDDENRKPGATPGQIAVIVFGLLFAFYMVGRNFLPSNSSSDTLPAAMAPVAPSPDWTRTSFNPGTTSTDTSGKASTITPQRLPFTIAVSPNPNINVGTMAIVPTDPNISTGQAASLAAFTLSQFTQMKRWKKLYIYVFRDQQSANQFANYQRPRRGMPLSGGDYSNLSNLWGSALSCYEYDNGSSHVYTPTNNPSGWWTE